jgi:hypothetical protein
VKTQQEKARKERLAERDFRKYVRLIPDNAKFINILLQLHPTLRAAFYQKAKKYLRFEPVALEAIQ